MRGIDHAANSGRTPAACTNHVLLSLWLVTAAAIVSVTVGSKIFIRNLLPRVSYSFNWEIQFNYKEVLILSSLSTYLYYGIKRKGPLKWQQRKAIGKRFYFLQLLLVEKKVCLELESSDEQNGAESEWNMKRYIHKADWLLELTASAAFAEVKKLFPRRANHFSLFPREKSREHQRVVRMLELLFKVQSIYTSPPERMKLKCGIKGPTSFRILAVIKSQRSLAPRFTDWVDNKTSRCI